MKKQANLSITGFGGEGEKKGKPKVTSLVNALENRLAGGNRGMDSTFPIVLNTGNAPGRLAGRIFYAL